MRLHSFIIVRALHLLTHLTNAKQDLEMSVVLKLVWIFLMVIFKKTLILFGRQQTVNLNNTITKMPEARKKKKKPNTTPPTLSLRTKGKWLYCLEMMMQSFLKQNFWVERICLQIETYPYW